MERILPQNRLTERLNFFLNSEALINHRPNWLINPVTKCNLEIDIYYPSFNIGFEYNGAYHYDKKLHNHKYILFKDKIKIDICKKNKVDLIVLRAFNLGMSDKDLIRFVCSNISKKKKRKFLYNFIYNNIKKTYSIISKYEKEFDYYDRILMNQE